VLKAARTCARIMTAIGDKAANRWHLQFAERWVVPYNFYVNDARWAACSCACAMVAGAIFHRGAGRDGLYSPEDSYVANLLGALDALIGGITTVYDWSHNNNSPEHSDPSVQGLKDVGMRGIFGYGNSNAEGFPPNNLPINYDDFRRVREQHFGSDDQLATMAMASARASVRNNQHYRHGLCGRQGALRAGDGLWASAGRSFRWRRATCSRTTQLRFTATQSAITSRSQ
jgi:hypothetical protein